MSGRTILAIGTHPDDIELTCAGSVARWIQEGDRAVLVVATDGARGGKLPGGNGEAMARLRRAEQMDAAAVLGIADVTFLGFPDGELEDTRQLRGSLVEVVRRHRPDIVVVMDPLTVILRDSYVNHRDHRMLGMATLDALYPQASNAAYFPEQVARGFLPHKVPELLLTATERPNFWVDVTATLDRRFDALRRHRSQVRLWPDGGEAVIEEQRRLAAAVGADHGMTYAEEFRRVLAGPLT